MPPADTIKGSVTHSEPSPSAGIGQEGLYSEIQSLRQLVLECDTAVQGGKNRRLPGNVAFMADGRVLCREREFGDSRYPYGTDGFNFWISASGLMRGNRGLYFLFLPALDGDEPPIAFFAGYRAPGTSSFVSHSLLPVPFIPSGEARIVDRYSVIGHDATYFVAETPEMLSVVRVFVEQTRSDHAHINFSTLIENHSGEPLDVYLSSYMNPFCRHQFVETNEDCWFKKIQIDPSTVETSVNRVDEANNDVVLPSFVVSTNEDMDRFRSICNYSLIRRSVSLCNAGGVFQPMVVRQSQGPAGDSGKSGNVLTTEVCTSRQTYVGSMRRSLGSASFLDTGSFVHEVPLTVFKETAVAGDLLRMNLPADNYLRTNHVFSTPDSQDILDLELSRPLRTNDVDRAFQLVSKTTNQTGDLDLRVRAETSPEINAETFNKFLPYLKKQVSICALLKGYMHPSANSLIGFRDVLQAVEGHLLDQPKESRAKFLETLGHVLVDGRCPRQYSLPVQGSPGQADLREFVDQGVWAISTVYSYLATTGDFSLLDEVVGYHQASPADENTTTPASERDTVLEHLLRIMDYLSAKRNSETGLVLALYGDWNDALDGLGISSAPDKQFGSGVSVMTSLQFYQCCKEIIEILRRHQAERFSTQIEKYEALRQQLREGLLNFAVVEQDGHRKILHGWGDRRSYLVGSFSDSDGLSRDGLTSNAFWVLSGMLEEDPSMRQHILSALERLDSTYGLRTFEPGFAPDAPGVGRITKLPRGTAENGAVYVHATTFGIAALFKMGQPERAWEQIRKILPFSPHHKQPSHSPFVMPNSYVDNLQLDLAGQSMNDWQTGCSNVLLKLLVKHVFGFEPQLDCLRIAPATWHPFTSLEFNGVAHGKNIRIEHHFDAVSEREFYLNCNQLEALPKDKMAEALVAYIPYEELADVETNRIVVVDPRI